MIALYSIENLKLHYRTPSGSHFHAIDGVSLELHKGDTLGILGDPGCGKSTLAHGAMGLFQPPLFYTSGDIRINGESLIGQDPKTIRREVLAKKLAMIPQDALNALNPLCTIEQFATDILLSHYPQMSKKEAIQRLRERFHLIGLSTAHVLRSYPRNLTPELILQTVIGLSTLMNPKVVFADMPSVGLDDLTSRQITGTLLKLLQQEIIQSLVVFTTDAALLRESTERIAVMYAGEFVESGSTDAVLPYPCHPYTQAILQQGEPSRSAPPPELSIPPVGCRYAHRCPIAQEDCTRNRPQNRTVIDRDVRCLYAQ